MMEDMTAFERQLSTELVEMAGPGRRIDAMAMVRTATTSVPRWGFQSMFSATKFVVAGVIVALFSGFLLAGVLTQPSDDSVPAVGASASAPEPSASGETSSMVWERLEVPAGMGYESLRYSTGTFLVATSPRQTVVSRDGLDWSEVPVQGEIVDSYGGTLVVADGDRLSTVRAPGDAGASQGLVTLDRLALPSGASMLNARIAYGPAGLVLVTCGELCSKRRTVWHTGDGRAWKRAKRLPPRGGFEDVIATADGYVARTDLGGRWDVLYSRDGLTWKRVDQPIHPWYALVGSAPFGTLLQGETIPRKPPRALAVVTRHGLEPLKVPAEVRSRWARSEPDGWGAGGLGVVGVFDGLVALSTDGTTWHLEALPDTVPRLRFGDNGIGRPLLHVTEDTVLLETTTCLEPDPRPQVPYSTPALPGYGDTEVDCPGLYGSGQKVVWFRGTPS